MTAPKVRGLNHLTLAVIDLHRSIGFYRDVLGCTLRAQWDAGAYLEAGLLWLCLSVDPAAELSRSNDYTHYSFDVDPGDFDALSIIIRRHAPLWKDNRSEGPSLYFLDPDGHKLELHAGSLASRLAHHRVYASDRVTVL